MPVILHLESSTRVCSVALSYDRELLYSEICLEGPSHASQLGVFVDEALKVAESRGLNLDAVSVSGGPGSYTGLRIGVSMAKGIAYARHIPLIAVPTLEILCRRAGKKTDIPADALLCPMIDARRMEVYTALYDTSLNNLQKVQALIVEEDSFSELPPERKLFIFGDGASKCAPVIRHPGLCLVEDVVPQACDMTDAALEAWEARRFEDVAYYEPFYLKEFQATVPHKLNELIHPTNS